MTPARTPGAVRLHPTFSDITSIAGYQGSGNTSANPNLGAGVQYCNASRIVPELPTVLNPYGVKNFQVAATLDEGNNYVNMKYGPLYASNPVTGVAFGNYLRNDMVVPAALYLGTSLNTTTTGQATFYNTGTVALTVGTTLGGTNVGQFSLASGCNGSIPAGGSCVMTVTFAPTSPTRSSSPPSSPSTWPRRAPP